jgi:hypothetical protein
MPSSSNSQITLASIEVISSDSAACSASSFRGSATAAYLLSHSALARSFAFQTDWSVPIERLHKRKPFPVPGATSLIDLQSVLGSGHDREHEGIPTGVLSSNRLQVILRQLVQFVLNLRFLAENLRVCLARF